MELLFNHTARFEQTLNVFGSEEQIYIAQQINRYAYLLLNNRLEFDTQTYQPQPVTLVDGLDSSLCVLPLNQHIALIVAVDEDPIFDQIILTLMSVVGHDEVSDEFVSVVEQLYQNDLFASASRYSANSEIIPVAA